MKISYKWLLELTGLDWEPEDLGDRLTLCGTACEYIDSADQYMQGVIVGEILAINKIEGADKIRLATVNLGERQLDVVCGAPNIEVGLKVPVATLGAKLDGGIVIKKAKIRGIKSEAMICSERELGLSDEHAGILVLDPSATPGQELSELLGYKDDFMMTFELTPNRPDSMSAVGIARDMAALASIKVNKPIFELTESNEKTSDYIKVTIDDTVACPRYAARIIKNVTIGESPYWLKKKLVLSGVRPISNIVDITNFVMLELGQPLHAFDYDRFGSKEVVVRMGKDKEPFKSLDGADHELTPEVIMITNGTDGVAAGGVMGGFNSEVEKDTKNILLEAAYFNASMIRKSRRQLGFVTESSQRFEKGADPNIVEYAIDYAASLMQSLCGGEVLEGIVDCYPNVIEPLTIKFRPKRCNDIIGTELSADRMKQIFEDLEFTVTGNFDFEVRVPTFRPDIEREIDLIEEIARIIGFDNIPASNRNIGSLYTPIHYEDKFKKESRTVLTSVGFDEIISHGLADSKLADILHADRPQLNISNPISEDLNIMRNCLLKTALTVIHHNVSHRSLDLSIFEIGKIYFPPDANGNWAEDESLVLAVTGNTQHTWRDKPRPRDFYDITGAINALAEHFGWGDFSFNTKDFSFFEKEISFEISLQDKVCGLIGKINQKTAKKFGIKQDVFAAELDFAYLLSLSNKLIVYKTLPIYPAALRDLAMIVREEIKAGDLITQVKKSAGKYAESVEIFDLYQGKQIEKGKKSIAISISYRSKDSSLESSQVDEAQKKVVHDLVKNYNVEIRDK